MPDPYVPPPGFRLVQPVPTPTGPPYVPPPGFTLVEPPRPPAPAVPVDPLDPYAGVGQANARFLTGLMEWTPALGGSVGGVLGGIPGAALGGAAGEAARQLLHRTTGAPAPETSVEAARQIATQAGVQGAAEGVGQAVGGVMNWGARRLMQSALKPPVGAMRETVKTGVTPEAVQTLLHEGVNVTPGGLEQLNTLLGATRADIKAAIAEAGPQTIHPLRVASRLNDVADTFARQVNPVSDLNAISAAGEEFLSTTGGRPLSLQAAQALKTGTNAMLKGKYGELTNAATEAQKALVRGLKEELESAVPGIEAMNLRQGDLMEAAKMVGRRVAMAGNRDPVGFAWVVQHPLLFLTALADRSPLVKSLVARGAYTTAATAAQTTPQLIRAAVVALTSAPEPQMRPEPLPAQ